MKEGDLFREFSINLKGQYPEVLDDYLYPPPTSPLLPRVQVLPITLAYHPLHLHASMPRNTDLCPAFKLIDNLKSNRDWQDKIVVKLTTKNTDLCPAFKLIDNLKSNRD